MTTTDRLESRVGRRAGSARGAIDVAVLEEGGPRIANGAEAHHALEPYVAVPVAIDA